MSGFWELDVHECQVYYQVEADKPQDQQEGVGEPIDFSECPEKDCQSVGYQKLIIATNLHVIVYSSTIDCFKLLT